MIYSNSEADNFARLYLNLEAYPCPLFIMRSSAGYAASMMADTAARAIGGQEGMMNVLAWRKDDVLYTVFIPRSAHRPACYFAPETEAIHISPGALDMAGVMVATDESSFSRLSIQTVEQIIREVGVTREQALTQARAIIRELGEKDADATRLRHPDLSIVTFPID
jgi:hypothetical protein